MQLKSVLPVLFSGLALGAAEVMVWPSVNAPDGCAKGGDELVFSVKLTAKDKKTPVAGNTVEYRVRRNGVGSAIAAGKLTAPGTFTVKSEPSSWYRVEFRPLEADGKPCKVLNPADAAVGVVTDAAEFKSAIPESADFDAFWNRALAELAAMPLEAKTVEQEPPAKFKGKFRVFDVKIPCPGGAPVSGILTVPADLGGKTAPVIASFHGAGVFSAVPQFEDGAIRFNVNAHGIENGRDANFYRELARGALRGYERRGLPNPETAYFRGMFQRAVRAVDYLATRPDWNRRDLIVMGGSMAAAQAIAAAALRPKLVTLCVTDFPAMCDHAGSLAPVPRTPGWPQFYSAAGQPALLPEKIRKWSEGVNYFDMIHFGKRLKCPFFTSIGYADAVTPPPGVLALVNSVPKDLLEKPDFRTTAGHGGIHSWTGRKELRDIIRNNRERE